PSAAPYGQAGEKRYAFPPPCPQVGGCPQASQHPATRQDEFDSGKGETSSRLPGPFSLFLPESCPNNRNRCSSSTCPIRCSGAFSGCCCALCPISALLSPPRFPRS